MTNIDDLIGGIVNNKNFDDTVKYEVIKHRLQVLKDAMYLMDIINRNHPPKNPELFTVHRKDGSFAYHQVIEYQLPRGKTTDYF